MKRNSGLLLVLILSLSACSVVSPEVAGTLAPVVCSEEERHWWRVFGDETLNKLALRLRGQSIDIRTAHVRINQARAIETETMSGLLPVILASASQQRTNAQVPIPFTVGLQRGTLDAAWELDLFGRVRAEAESAQYGRISRELEAEAVEMAVTAELVRLYAEWKLQHRIRESTEQGCANSSRRLEITRQLVSSGRNDRRDLERVAFESSQWHALRQAAESELINAQLRLERLFGVLPGELHHDLGDAAFQLPLVVMPQVVLERELIRARARPEIRYASAQLYRRAADLRVTEAALWPRVTIGGFWGAQDLSVPAVAAANPIWAFSQSASLPILNFGRLQAAVDVADSELQIALLEYQRAVSSALTTTREAAEQYLNQTNQYQQVQEQLAQINQLVRAERLRFKAGMTGEDVPLEQTLAMHRQSIALVLVEISLVSQYARFQKEIGFCGPDESVVNL